MSVHDSQPGGIYADEFGKLWRVVGIFSEPSVIVEEVEPNTPSTPKVQRHGGVTGFMWAGFRRVFRPDMKARVKADAKFMDYISPSKDWSR